MELGRIRIDTKLEMDPKLLVKVIKVRNNSALTVVMTGSDYSLVFDDLRPISHLIVNTTFQPGDKEA